MSPASTRPACRQPLAVGALSADPSLVQPLWAQDLQGSTFFLSFFLGQHFLNPRPGAYSSLLVYQESWGQKRGAQDIPSLILERFWEMTKETQERAGDRRQKEHLCQLTPHSVRRPGPHMPLPTASTSWEAVYSAGTLWGLTNHQLPRSEGPQLSHAQTDLWGAPCKAQEGEGRDTAPVCPPSPQRSPPVSPFVWHLAVFSLRD